MIAQCSPPPSEPANSAFFRLSAIGLMLRSTTLESISTRPSPINRVRPFQRESADRLGQFGLLADHLQLAAEPRFELVDDDAAFVLAHRASLVRAAATDVRLDFIECIDARQCLAGNGPRAGCGEFIETAAHMCPAERQFDVTALGHHTIAGISVDLQDSLEAGQMRNRPLGLAIWRVDVDDYGRIGAAPRPIVACIGPELAGFGAAATGIENRRRRLIRKELPRTLQRGEHALMDRTQQPRGTADPIRHGRTIEYDALAGVDLRLPVQREMIGILRYKNLCDRRIGWHATFDQPCGRRRLHNTVFTRSASVFGPAYDQPPELCRHDVEPLAHILADPVKHPRAARARLVSEVDNRLDAR